VIYLIVTWATAVGHAEDDSGDPCCALLHSDMHLRDYRSLSDVMVGSPASMTTITHMSFSGSLR